MLLSAVHIDDNEVTNGSVVSNQSRIIFSIQQNKVKLVKLRQECYQSTIVPL